MDWRIRYFLDWVLFANLSMFRLEGTEHMDKAYHQKFILRCSEGTRFAKLIDEMPLEEAKHYLKGIREFYTAGWMKIMGQ